MIDVDKVIKGLECIISSGNAGMRDDCANCIYTGSGDCLAPALRDALALLKAQEPVKPIRYQEGRWFKTWRCGACGGTLVFRNGEDKPKYCIDCGKAVKWE